MTFLNMVESQERLWHLLINEKISIGLKKHQENTLIKKLLIFYYLILLPQTTLKIYGLEKLSILEKGFTQIGQDDSRV